MTLFVVPTAYYWLARHTGSPMKLAQNISGLEQEIPYKKGELK